MRIVFPPRSQPVTAKPLPLEDEDIFNRLRERCPEARAVLRTKHFLAKFRVTSQTAGLPYEIEQVSRDSDTSFDLEGHRVAFARRAQTIVVFE